MYTVLKVLVGSPAYRNEVLERLVDLHLQHVHSRGLDELATRILDDLDCLVVKYSELLAAIPAYAATPSSYREALVRNALTCLAASFSSGRISLFTEYFQKVYDQGLRRGVPSEEIEWALSLLPAFLHEVRADSRVAVAIWHCVTSVVSESRRGKERVPI